MTHIGFTLTTFILVTALVGVIAAKMTGKDNDKTTKGYFLAGSGLGGAFIAGSMLLTNLSAENLVGLSGQSYGANMSGMAWEATAVIATIVMAFIFLPLYLKKGYTTLPEFMEERYGVTVRRMVSLLFLVGYLLVGIPVCLYAGAIAFNQIFNLSAIFGISTRMSLTIMIVAIGIIGALYAVVGGLKSVAISDTINGILLILGSVMVVVFGFTKVGQNLGGGFATGLMDVINNSPEKLNAIGGKTDPVPFACIFTGMLLANLFYWGTNQVLIQRALGAKNLKEGQKGVLFSGLLKMLVPFLLVVPGVIASRLVPGLESNDFAYGALVNASLPWPVVGIFCAALFGSIISTYDSFLNAASTIFMMDLFRPIFRPDMSEEKTVSVAKKIGWLFAAFAIVFTPFLDVLSQGLYDFGRSFTGFYNIPIITMVLVGIFWKKGSSLGAICATVWHVFFYSGFKFWFKYVPVFEPITHINYMHIYAISFLVMLAIIAVCAKIKPNEKTFSDKTSRTDNYDMRPWNNRVPFAVGLVSFLIYEYYIFSPAGLATTNHAWGRMAIFTIALLVEFAGLAYICKTRKNDTDDTDSTDSENGVKTVKKVEAHAVHEAVEETAAPELIESAAQTVKEIVIDAKEPVRVTVSVVPEA